MIRIGILLIVMTLLTGTAVGEEVQLEPQQDAFVCDCIPNATNPMLGIQYLAQGRYSACHNRSFLQWDLSSIPDSATIESAEFRVYCASFYGSVSGEMCFYLLTEDWDETTVTYMNMPAYTDSAAIYSSDWPSGGTWLTLDVTDFVEAWYSESIDNYGMYCHSRSCTSTCDCAYYSSNVSNPSYRPSLTVYYSIPSSLDRSTWGEIKVNPEIDCGCAGDCPEMPLPPQCPDP
ncbi:MAG: DNRLRE domain-containing protein [Candidatus Aegiribacteria sp.]|nr:DNRLRE domain-containing protein [Candidatus Aegiribacteria sp.]